MTRSTPYMSSSGKPRPQSTTIMSLPYSSTVMFLPISFKPPSGMIFSFSANKITTPLMIKTQACRRTVMLCHSEERSGVGISGKCFEFAGIYRKIKNDAARLPRPLAGPRNHKTGSFDRNRSTAAMKKRARPPLRVRKTGKWVSSVCGLCKTHRSGRKRPDGAAQRHADATENETSSRTREKTEHRPDLSDETRARAPGMPRREAGKL